MKTEVLDKYIKEKHSQEECISFIDGYESVEKKMFEVFQKLVLRGCFKTDRDYNVAKQTLLEITGINYEQEVDNL